MQQSSHKLERYKSFLSNTTIIAMLLATWKFHDKQVGIVHLMLTTYLYPCSTNLLKVKLDYPKELKDDKQTLQNPKDWDSFLEQTEDTLKAKIIKQGKQTAGFYQEQQLKTFHNNLLTIAEGYDPWAQ
jgi:hypothetical protein